MTACTLGVHGLPSAEAGLVRALLTLLGTGDAGFRWTFVPAGRCDVLVADAACAAPEQARSERQARALLLLGKAASGDSDALQRPLRANELEAALRRIGPLLGCADAPADAPAATTDATAATVRYKLLQWPPAALLRGEPQRMRMATQLSRRFLSATELAQLTNQDVARCLVLLQLLQGFGLLQAEPQVPSATPRAPEAQAVPPAGGWALVRSIRRRLGL